MVYNLMNTCRWLQFKENIEWLQKLCNLRKTWVLLQNIYTFRKTELQTVANAL